MQDNNMLAADDMKTEEGDARSKATFRFTVPNFSTMTNEKFSDAFVVRNLKWKIKVLPNGLEKKVKTLGVYILCNNESTSTTWSCFALVEIKLVSQKEGVEDFICKNFLRLYCSDVLNWGLPNVIGWDIILDPENGYIKDDNIIIEVNLSADAPNGVNWDSKTCTGCVGLKNQCATFYVNSLLQTLYFTKELRMAVFKVLTESDKFGKCVAFDLLTVFYELQYSDKPVGVKRLTWVFELDTTFSFKKNNMKEFLRMLLDKLKNEMEGTSAKGTVSKLYEGQKVSFIECKKTGYQSQTIETFYSIDLNTKGMKDIDESFQDCISPKIFEGDEKYDAGDHGLQDAEKRVTLTKLPPVLHLNLKDVQDNSENGRFEFSEKLDLTKYVQSDDETSAIYTLYSVFVYNRLHKSYHRHCNDHGGLYVVYINPDGDGEWYKFDDEVVSKCTKQDVIDNNYKTLEYYDYIPFALVYINDSELSTVLQTNSIPRAEGKLNFMLDNGLYTDVKINISYTNNDMTAKTFHAHSILLTYASPVFNTMLKSESKEKKAHEIDIVDVYPNVFKAFLTFIYERNVDIGCSKLAWSLFGLGLKYLVEPLQNTCIEFIEKNINCDTVWEAINNADTFGLQEIKAKCRELIVSQTSQCLCSSTFMDLEEKDVAFLLDVENLSVSEARLFNRVEAWMKEEISRKGSTEFEREKIKQSLASRFIPKIRFFAMSFEEFSEGPLKSDFLTTEQKLFIISKLISKEKPLDLVEGICLFKDRCINFHDPSSAQFKQDSYIYLSDSWWLDTQDSSVSFLFKTTSSNGLIFSICDDESNYISIGICNGILKLILNKVIKFKTENEISINKRVDDDQVHSLAIIISPCGITIILDVHNIMHLSHDKLLKTHYRQACIGARPIYDTEWTQSKAGFNGCISSLVFKGKTVNFQTDYEKIENIQPCKCNSFALNN